MKKIFLSQRILIVVFTISLSILISCKKDWLEAKPSKSLVVPITIGDFQALLDNTTNVAPFFNDKQSTYDEFGAGDFTVTDANLNSRKPVETNVYLWSPEIYEDRVSSDEWNLPYQRIFYSNVVLEGIQKIIPKNEPERTAWAQVKGSALFFRAYNNYNIAQLFCAPYDAATANTDLGIPIRTEADINIKAVRVSVGETYDAILGDLKEAASLLPIETPISDLYQVRPNKSAVLAMLARVYLSMSNYDSANLYADKSLQLYNRLMRYDSIPVLGGTGAPIAALNDEVLFYMRGNNYFFFGSNRLIRDSVLYTLYENNDARKRLFFKTTGTNRSFFGSYTGAASPFFTGLATDEMWLIRAECRARRGDIVGATNDLNTLLVKRYVAPYSLLSFPSANEALKRIIIERRKELCYRGIRWTDLRRLNKDPQFAITVTRTAFGQPLTLSPNSNLYVLPIPPEVIQLSGIPQNPR